VSLDNECVCKTWTGVKNPLSHMKTQHIMTSDLLATGQCPSAGASHITIYGEKQGDLMILKQ